MLRREWEARPPMACVCARWTAVTEDADADSRVVRCGCSESIWTWRMVVGQAAAAGERAAAAAVRAACEVTILALWQIMSVRGMGRERESEDDDDRQEDATDWLAGTVDNGQTTCARNFGVGIMGSEDRDLYEYRGEPLDGRVGGVRAVAVRQVDEATDPSGRAEDAERGSHV